MVSLIMIKIKRLVKFEFKVALERLFQRFALDEVLKVTLHRSEHHSECIAVGAHKCYVIFVYFKNMLIVVGLFVQEFDEVEEFLV